MSKSKMVGIITLVVFVLGIALVGTAVAGEKFKWRIGWYRVKGESVKVPSEEGRIMVVFEDKGMLTVLQGNPLMDRMAGFHVGSVDVNSKMGKGFGHGEAEFTDRDGDKMYWAWEGKVEKGIWSGPANMLRGTGKFAGKKGKATFAPVTIAPNQLSADWEGEIE